MVQTEEVVVSINEENITHRLEPPLEPGVKIDCFILRVELNKVGEKHLA